LKRWRALGYHSGVRRRILCSFLLCITSGFSQALSGSLASEIESLNRAAAGSEARLSAGDTNRRQALLHQLIERDPKQALALATLESPSETVGILEATVEEDFIRRKSKKRWALRLADGNAVDLFFADGVPETGGCGRALRANGIRIGTRMAVRGFAPAPEARDMPQLTSSQCSTFSSGTRNVAVLMLQTSTSTLPAAVTSTALTNAFFGAPQSLRTYWSEVSYNRVTATGSVFGPFTLDANYTCNQTEQILSAAIRAADASVDFTQYHHVVLIVPNNTSGCPLGLGSIGCRNLTSPSRGAFSSGVSWLRADYLDRNDAIVSVAAHELGHNLSLDHANTMTFPTVPLGDPATATFDEYGNYFSTMGLSFTFNGRTLIGHYDMPHKYRLGWLEAANVTTVNASGTYTIAPVESPNAGPQALRIRRANNADLWIEYRRNAGFNATTAPLITNFNGAWIYYQSPSLTFDESYTNLLNFHPGTDVENSLLLVGETWQDPATTLRLRVDTATNAGLTITVTNPPGIPVPTLTSVSTTPNPAVTFTQFTLTVNGSGFDPATVEALFGTTVNANATLITKTATQVQFRLTIFSPGTYNVTVRNGSGGIASNPLPVTVNSSGPVPTLTSISPNPATAGSTTFTLTGTNFNTATALVEVNRTAITPTSRSATQLVFTTNLAAGSYSIVARNGSAGVASNTLPLTVTEAAPVLSSISPNPAIAGSTTFTLTGTNFNTATALVEVNGTAITPTSRTATQLVFTTTLAAGSYSIVARNGSAGVASNTLPLTVAEAAPVLSSISPNPAMAGSNTFTVTGTNFNTTTALLELNGAGVTLTSRTATQLVFTRTISAGSYSVVVRNGSGGTASNTLTLTVNNGTPVPVLSSISPNPAVAGANTFTLIGTGFDATNAQVEVSGTVLTPSFRSATQLAVTTTLSIGTYSVVVRNGAAGVASNAITLTVNAAAGSHFVPIAPCRAVDTRPNSILARDSSRDFSFAACAIPANATALALNVTLVPTGQFGFLSIWPAGQARPVVSTMNSLDGRIKANAAIVGTGTVGAVSVYVTDAAHVILDVNGYFVPAGTAGALAFYPLDPCRVVDTRNTGGIVAANSTRTISGGCLPANAQAYSLNITSVPPAALGFLTLWPTGSTQPTVSTLNNLTGTVVANAAILRAGTGGAFNAFVTDASHLVADLNGYFAAPGSPGALSFYPSTPCRIFDTRNAVGAFGGPAMSANATRTFTVPSSFCGIPTSAKAYVTNATVLPSGVFGFLTMWPGGLTQPTVSTLNAVDGALTSNAAIVPASGAGVIQVYTSNGANMLLDISGYFAP
jgi:M6 family metalloprotease-like protein